MKGLFTDVLADSVLVVAGCLDIHPRSRLRFALPSSDPRTVLEPSASAQVYGVTAGVHALVVAARVVRGHA